MPTCQCSSATSTQGSTTKSTYLIAVVGNPNCGKTTIFNALTGLRHKVANYPGVTVEKREGAVTGDPSLRLLDLPGTYSLSARSLDEQIARDVLLGRVDGTPAPDAVLVVVDTTNLERNLYLASQVIELGMPTVVACNVMDLFVQAGHQLHVGRLAAKLGVPVVPTVGHRGQGLDALRLALGRAVKSERSVAARPWPLPDPIEREVEVVASALQAGGFGPGPMARAASLLWLSEGGLPETNHLPATAGEVMKESLARLATQAELDVATEITVARYSWLGDLVERCVVRAKKKGDSASDRLDRILTHKVWGIFAFIGIMAALFSSMFIVAEPLMGTIEAAVSWLQTLVARMLPPGLVSDLLRQGVIAGAGNVVAFFPQICILFLFIALLEDSGYMARAAFLMDRVMSRVGLHGKSFIPLLSCHACTVPGIMATRIIENRRDRLTTILVAPLMSCSARLPVYTVLVAACLPGSAWVKAGAVLGMYALGIIAALAMATVFKRTLLRGPAPTFIMELPPYRMPRPAAIFRVMWDRSRVFLTRAGTIILALTVVFWAMMNYPKDPARTAWYQSQRESIAAAGGGERLQQLDRQEAAEVLQNSLAGRLGRFVEPAIKPLGYDWKIGIGLLSSFAAREVFIGTLAVAYSVGDADSESSSLRKQLAGATWPDGRRLFTPAVALGLMVFYALSCQCISTLAITRRETNSWRWPVFMFAYLSLLAYVAALLVYQIGSRLID